MLNLIYALYLIIGFGVAAMFWWAISTGLRDREKNKLTRDDARLLAEAERSMSTLPGGVIVLLVFVAAFWPVPVVLFIARRFK